MNAFDTIIGYNHVKEELRLISDALQNRAAYERLGVTPPGGLLLYGEPGVGKSLMAAAVIEASGRKAFCYRKGSPGEQFVAKIKKTFDVALQNAPSIIFMDDMDKFSNEDENHPDAEEYVTIQSCIDEVKGKGVFVLATANQIRRLPKSLCRAGRFDRKIEIRAPKGSDAAKIVAHYIAAKPCAKGLDPMLIARIMSGRSCAELETVINEAGLFAGYERAESITTAHFMKACMHTVFRISVGPNETALDPAADGILAEVAYHEAGHAVVSEVLLPESITVVTVHCKDGERMGFTGYYTNLQEDALYAKKSRIAGALGGMAAQEQKFGRIGLGAETDIEKAFDLERHLVVNACTLGLRLHENDYSGTTQLLAEQEQAVIGEVERYYRKAKEILAANREFLEKLAAALMQKSS